MGDMGPPAAVKFTTRFLENYTPNLLINFGFSGTLSEDVKLGDVVVATLTDLYDDSGAIVEAGGVPYLRPSGRPIYTDTFKDQVDNFSFRFPRHNERWRRACKSGFEEL